MHDYSAIASTEGYSALFLQRNVENAKNYLRLPKHVEPLSAPQGPNWVALARMRSICNSGSIQCYFLIYPYHADILEMFDAAGMWQLFEAWKRDAVALLTSSANGPPAVLWDFSGYTQYAKEQVPPPGDKTVAMRWYWEAGHFKAALGQKMLDRMIGGSTEDFGVRLSLANIDLHLKQLRVQQDRYREEFPVASRRVRDLVGGTTISR
ncbi:MAG TPA: hypothetical protein VFC39_01740 [Acidobacteriaceae bacterium]|nr:hypothetical protein [Acidobacteriaceae bacterium]